MTAPRTENPVDVFAPARLGPLTLRNRTIKAATFEGMTPDALVTDDLIAFHRAVAAGGAAMTTVAYCAASPEGRTDRHQIFMRPEAVPGLRRLTDAVHAEGAKASAQIGHAGPVANARSNRATALAPSNQLSPLSLRLTRAATRADIRRITADHARAARIAIESGFDAVEIHFGHNYFTSAFLSPALNKRTDEYGGPLQNRARVAREVARAVRDEAGDEIAVTAKLNMDDGVPGGFWLDESLQVAQWLEADGTLDALELTCGSSLRNPLYLFRGDAPVRDFAAAMPQPQRAGLRAVGRFFLKSYPYTPLYMLEQARQFRATLSMPLILLGGVTDYEDMTRAMAEGFDFVAMGRALLREPDLVRRVEADHHTRSLCIHCNRCLPTIYSRTRCVLAVVS
ncbi:NADH:flavin oxidoreductase [Tomitella gaofuii]|uniref:NADH:flavin oxidoreductase n=1 Tax=Tomitella gaofuii TaxID=2760083 RepID=UPI001F424A3F|nr:NADH:flavin oxidoreductase [Tomitella gaofuii]